MEHAEVLQEIAYHIQSLIDFSASRRFRAERRAARTEFFGSQHVPRGQRPEDEGHFSSYLDWFMFDRTLTETGQSLVRQFVTEHPELPVRVRENLLGCEQSVYSTFQVKELNGRGVVILDLHGEPHDYYAVSEQAATSDLAVGDLITTRLIRWDERYYFYGLLEKWPESARELFRLEADLLQGTRLDPRWRYQWALESCSCPSRSAWLRRKRRGR